MFCWSKIDIIKNIYENNTFIDYAVHIVKLNQDNIQPYQYELNTILNKYQTLIDFMVNPKKFNLRKNILQQNNYLWFPYSKYLQHRYSQAPHMLR